MQTVSGENSFKLIGLFILFTFLLFCEIYLNGQNRNDQDEVVTERIRIKEETPEVLPEEELVKETFQRRKLVYDRACSALPLIQDVLQSQYADFEALLALHDGIQDVTVPLPDFEERNCIANKIFRSNVFDLTETMDLMICLPPKCGTTNWQKALGVHYLNLTKGPNAELPGDDRTKV